MAAAGSGAILLLQLCPGALFVGGRTTLAYPRDLASITCCSVRSSRPPIEPMAVNAIARTLQTAPRSTEGIDVECVVAEAIRRRTHDNDSSLTEEEKALITAWIGGVFAHEAELARALEELAAQEPGFYRQELGQGDETNPYVLLCRAECLLALFLLFRASPECERAVAFVDADKLSLLAGASL